MNNEQKEQMIKTNAFDGVSFDPEKRLERFISDIESKDNKIDEAKSEFAKIPLNSPLQSIAKNLEHYHGK